MTAIFDANLKALSHRHPDLAQRLADTPSPEGLTWRPSKLPDYPSAQWSGPHPESPDQETLTLTLASRFQPKVEAEKLTSSIDFTECGCVAIMGFGLGYHVRELFKRANGQSLILIFEPNLSLFRGVLEQIDYTDLLSQKHLYFFDTTVTRSALTKQLEKESWLIIQGLTFVAYPPTRQCHPQAVKTFTEQIQQFVAYCRTNVATTMVHTQRTCQNLMNNLSHYTAGQTTNFLENLCPNQPAVIVSAGPSLAKNVELLCNPIYRASVRVIAVQTALKPLLQRGIRPDFVTALDYHVISRRFYDDLPDLSDTILVAEPKTHHQVLNAYPGPVAILNNRFLNMLLGPLQRPITPIPAGSTVAHLAFYLAQHLGCDPISFIGQDLGFSEGLYYCPGTAIHDVWATELNAFNTLETMELKRIFRHKTHLRQQRDINDQPIYTDEQMVTYLAHFERDFITASQTVIDATEGGLPKAHTIQQPFKTMLDQYAATPLPPLPSDCFEAQALDPHRITQLTTHLQAQRDDLKQYRQLSRRGMALLDQMLTDQTNTTKMDRHFKTLSEINQHVAALHQTAQVVDYLNQLGCFHRLRHDRSIQIDTLDPLAKQRRQIERDKNNLEWIMRSCDELEHMLDEAFDHLDQTTATHQNQTTPLPCSSPLPPAKPQEGAA